MIADPVRRYLEERGARYHTVRHEPRFTAQETAQAVHVSGKHFAKAVLLKRGSDGIVEYLIAVLPAHEQVNLERISGLLGERVMLAAEEETVRRFPGIEAGALPPLGIIAGKPVPVIADAALARAEWIIFHGGLLTELVEMTWPEYVRLVAPRMLDFARLPAPPEPAARTL